MKEILYKIEQLIEKNDLEKALNEILENEELLSNNYEYWNLRGVLCVKAYEYNTAILCFEESIRLEENFDAYYNLAYVYENKGAYSDSAIYYGLAEKYAVNKELKGLVENYYYDNETLFNIKNEAAKGKEKSFIVLSSCGFGDVLQRMHHISKSLAKLGHKVMYVSPSSTTTVNNDTITEETAIEYILKNKQIKDNIEIFQPLNIYCGKKFMFNTYNNIVQQLLNQCEEEVVIICYMPYQIETLKLVKGNFKVIYECVDDHTDFEYAFWSDKRDVIWEQELMDRADVITTTATSLYLQRVAIEGRNNVYLSRNAVNELDFILDKNDIPVDLINIPEPRIVYSGAIYEWFDKELFYNVVKTNPDKSFVIIGFGNEDILSEKCENLYFLGTKKHSELKQYLSHCQVGIIPFRDNIDLIINCDPIKQYEYIACNLPVVTTYFPECLISKANTFSANNYEDFNKSLNQALSLNVDNEKTINFIIDNSWNERATYMCNIIDNNVTEQEKEERFYKIGKELEKICSIEKAPIFETFRGMYLNVDDSKCFMESCKNAYNNNNNKFIERQYLQSLLINDKIEDASKIVLESNKISSEIKSELLLRKKMNDKQSIKIILYWCINNFNASTKLIKSMPECELKLFYTLFTKYLTGYSLNYSEIENLKLNNCTSPILETIYNELNNERNKITILIPTKDRPELLERCISYFDEISDSELEITIFILDVSCKENSEINKRLLNYKNIKVKYFLFDESTSHFSRVIKVYDEIETDFCCLCADDDFLCKEGLIKSIKMLIEKKDVVAVKGKSYIFIENDTSNIYDFPKDSCVNLVEENPLDRLNKFVDSWVPQLYYLVYRKNELNNILYDFIENNEEKINDTVFEEYLFYFLVTLYGKVLNIDEPLNIRNESVSSDGYSIPGFYKHTLDRNINKYYKKFKSKIINFCKVRKIKVEECDIDMVFSKFLKNSWNIDERYISLYKDSSNNKNINIFDCELLESGFKKHEIKNKFYRNVFFEISGKCNAKCKWCRTGNNNLKGIANGKFIGLKEFQDAITYMREKYIITNETNIALYNWGEPLLNPNYSDIVKFLYDENIKFSLSTNASKVIDYPKEPIYKNLSFITFSMPGFSQDSYDKIHGFNFEKIKVNIIEILKRLHLGGFRGTAIIAYHVYQFNINEIAEAEKFAANNGIKLECSYAYINDYERTKLYIESELEYEELKEMSKQLILCQYNDDRRNMVDNYVCPQYNYLTINEKLEIESCCVNKNVIGKLMELELEDIIKVQKNNEICKECNMLGIDYYAHNPLFFK